jgi:antitoxin VapB
MNEFEIKQSIMHDFMERHKIDALLLNRVSSFAWATGGAASYINTAVASGTASLLITSKGHYLITTNIEAPRLRDEERLEAQGWEFRIYPWNQPQKIVSDIARGLHLGADEPYANALDLSGPMSMLRANLNPLEVECFRELARLCAEAMNEAIFDIRPGQSENHIAGLLASASQKRGAQAIVNLIATDERIFKYRHPLPTGKRLEKYAMLVLCGRQNGLVCSITRLVYFGKLPDEIRKKTNALAQIDAAFIAATKPGRILGEVFQHGVEAYGKAGFADEWRNHHQGGPAGYEPREVIATAEATELVAVGQVYAWNPSIAGTKSEDSVLVTDTGHQVLTVIEGWPTIQVEMDGIGYSRPAILEME